VEAGLLERAHDAVEHLDGAVEHLEARLSGAAATAGGEDHEVGVAAVSVLAHADGERVSEAGGQVLEVKCLGARSLLVDVKEDDLVHEVLEHEAQGHVAAHTSRADDDRLARPDVAVHLLSYLRGAARRLSQKGRPRGAPSF
jgi:hypothetical protein